MNEIEGKILEITPEEKERVLDYLGRSTPALFNGDIYALYYDNGNLNGKQLRVRRSVNRVFNPPVEKKIITLKLPGGETESIFKTNKELELFLEDSSCGITTFFENLGFHPIKQVIKHREMYMGPEGTRIVFDKVDGCSEWLEIEAEDEEVLMRVFKELGFDLFRVSKATTEKLISMYNSE